MKLLQFPVIIDALPFARKAASLLVVVYSFICLKVYPCFLFVLVLVRSVRQTICLAVKACVSFLYENYSHSFSSFCMLIR